MTRSTLEEIVFLKIVANRLPMPERQYKFCETRRWKSDFCWPDKKLILEVEGGTWINGKHTRGKGFEQDCEKYNSAVCMGYKVLRITGKHISTNEVIDWLKRILENDESLL